MSECLPPSLKHWCLWCDEQDFQQGCVPPPRYIALGVAGPFLLHAPQDGLHDLIEIQHWRIRLLFQDIGRSFLPKLAIPQKDNVPCALTMQIGRALQDKNLGIRCQLSQQRLRYLPYDKHPVLGMARRLSYINTWHLVVTLPHNVVYFVFHLFVHIAYIGITTTAPIRRLRKHMTNAMWTSDCATLPAKMSTTDLAHWGIIPLQYVVDDFLASVPERHWWYVFRKYVVNDIPPGINRSGDSKKDTGFLNKRVITVIQGIREARALGDYPRVKYLQADLRDLASQLSLPLQTVGSVSVGNISPEKNANSRCRAVNNSTMCCAFMGTASALLVCANCTH